MTQLNFTVTVPPGFVSGGWELTPYDSYAVGSQAVVAPFQGAISGAGVLTALDGSAATVVVPATGGFDAGRGLLTTHFKTNTGVVNGRPVIVPLVETSAGAMDVAYLVSVGRAQVITPQQAVDFQALMAQGYSARDAANTAAANANVAAALAGAVPYSSLAAFPVASGQTGRAAIALDTGGVYRSDGTTWGAPIGYVAPKSSVDSLAAQVAAVQSAQAAGYIGYQTQAQLFADLARPVNTLARVTNDATPANNGDYIKVGASGTGSWQQASTSRLAIAETNINANTATLAKIAGFSFKPYAGGFQIGAVTAVLTLADSAGTVAVYWDANGTMYAPGGLSGPLSAVTAAITAATITTLTATTAVLGGTGFTLTGSGYVGNIPAAFALQDSAGATVLYIGFDGTVYAPGGLNVSNLVVNGTLALAALTAGTGTVGGVTFTAPNSIRYVNGVLANNITQDSAGSVVSYFGPDGTAYFPGGIVAPNAVTGVGLAADGRVTINGMKMITSRNFVAFGDSLTAGSGSSGSTKTAIAQAATILGDGRANTNKGIGGNQAQHIAARAGALPVYVTVTGGSLPADTSSVTVVPTIRLLDGSGVKTLPVTIAGVPGTLTHDNGDSSAAQQAANPYTFVRTTAGSAVAVSGSALLTPDNTATADDLHVIWMGVNDLGGSDTAGIVARVQAAIRATVDNIRTPSKRFAVLTLVPGGRTSSSDPLYYTQMQQINAWIAATYPSNSIDVTTPLITYGGNSDGSVPASLRVDIIHMTDTGYGIVGNEIAKFITWKGY